MTPTVVALSHVASHLIVADVDLVDGPHTLRLNGVSLYRTPEGWMFRSPQAVAADGRRRPAVRLFRVLQDAVIAAVLDAARAREAA